MQSFNLHSLLRLSHQTSNEELCMYSQQACVEESHNHHVSTIASFPICLWDAFIHLKYITTYIPLPNNIVACNKYFSQNCQTSFMSFVYDTLYYVGTILKTIISAPLIREQCLLKSTYLSRDSNQKPS